MVLSPESEFFQYFGQDRFNGVPLAVPPAAPADTGAAAPAETGSIAPAEPDEESPAVAVGQ